MNKLRKYVMALSLAVVLVACAAPEGNTPGSEYMPDMAHSVAKEANLLDDYYYNTWNKRSSVSLYELTTLNEPVKGTIPRGYTGGNRHSDTDSPIKNAMSLPMNGHVPYHFENSPEGREAAIAQLLDNPFPITEKGLAQGKKMYEIYCGLCHGNEGNGLGYLYDDEANPNARYPLAPANFMTDQFYQASNGRLYHAIYYGYNAMGSYADKISYEERWQVIHYIRSLQAAKLGFEYNEEANTFNAAFGTPAAMVSTGASHENTHSLDNESTTAHEGDAGHHSSDDHDDNSHTTIINK